MMLGAPECLVYGRVECPGIKIRPSGARLPVSYKGISEKGKREDHQSQFQKTGHLPFVCAQRLDCTGLCCLVLDGETLSGLYTCRADTRTVLPSSTGSSTDPLLASHGVKLYSSKLCTHNLHRSAGSNRWNWSCHSPAVPTSVVPHCLWDRAQPFHLADKAKVLWYLPYVLPLQPPGPTLFVFQSVIAARTLPFKCLVSLHLSLS